MTTSLMSINSLEIGDILYIHGDLYTVIDTDYADEGTDLHVITLLDEEGNRKRLTAPGNNEVKLVVTEYV